MRARCIQEVKNEGKNTCQINATNRKSAKKQVESTLVSPVELHRVLSLFIHLRLCHYSLMKAAEVAEMFDLSLIDLASVFARLS